MLKDILVHIDTGERCRVRLEIAIGLARRHQARLTGLFAQLETDGPSVVARKAGQRLREATAAARTGFEQAAAAAGIDCRWLALPIGEYNYVLRETIICARYADLVILGQHDPDLEDLVPADLPEEVVLHSGRPVLLIPYVGAFPVLGERPVIAWNGEREAVRALNDALPLLKDARRITVLGLHARTFGETPESVPQVSILDHLACHGLKAQTDNLVISDSGGADLLLSRAADLSADLLVIGAHGHYGFPYLQRGGSTRHILRQMPMPVLMSH
jgi:nucleotide-binding universal stress UspA family protein